jgi:CheY-like chemotaxis protein
MYRHAIIIDDSPIDLTLTAVVIQKNELAQKVSSFNSGVAALEYLRQINLHSEMLPDIMFLDIHMPLLDGFGFLDAFIKFNWPAEKMPIVVFASSTINDSDFTRIASYTLKKHFVSKPVTMSVIAQLMADLSECNI